MRKLKEKFWGEDLIRAIICAAITAVCLAVITVTGRGMETLTKNAAAKYHCDTTSFSYNEEEGAATPLGYCVICKNYTDDGQLTKKYEYDENAKDWFVKYTNYETIQGIAGFIGGVTALLTLLFLGFMIDGMFFIHKLNKTHDKRTAKMILEAGE